MSLRVYIYISLNFNTLFFSFEEKYALFHSANNGIASLVQEETLVRFSLAVFRDEIRVFGGLEA